MRSCAVTFVGLLATLLVAACGDDSPANFDARIDGPPGQIDAATFKGFEADEGGEVRVEYVRFPTGNAATRVTAFLFQNPGSPPYHDFINLNGCTDLTPHTMWPVAQNADRQYIDPGGVLISGGSQPLMVERKDVMGRDPFFREHPPNDWFFHFQGATGTDGPTYMTPNSRLDVTFTGSSEMAGVIYDDAMYVPQDFALNTPPAGPVTLPATGDQ